MRSIDESVLADYNAGIERNRLRSDIGLIEYERTKELLSENLPSPPAVIYDIGGAYGEYAWWLSSLGYEVHLFDLSKTNIEMSNELASEYPLCHLHSAEVADARSVPRHDKSADAVLLMGPLYHITEYEERLAAIKESRRLLKDGGILVSAALTPYSVLLNSLTKYRVEGKKLCYALDKPEYVAMIERELKDGCHVNPGKSVYDGLGTSHLHTAKALREELANGGFPFSEVHGILGGAWLVHNLEELWADEKTREILMYSVRLLDSHEEVLGLSGHLLAISKNTY